MKGLGRILLTTTTAMVMSATPSTVSTTAAGHQRPPGVRWQQSLDEIVAAGATGVVAVVRDGHLTWHGSSGVTELGGSRPVPTGARFRGGSVTKTFVATVVLQLVNAKLLRIDDTVERWLPGVVPAGDSIRIEHLLGHTSGLFDYLATLPLPPSPKFEEIRWRTWTPTELVARATSRPPLFEPGHAWAYSNTNYVLLGMIVQRATGRPYAEEVERRILRPLGLSRTTFPGTDPRIRGPHLHGFRPIDGPAGPQPVDVTEMNPSVMSAAGEVVTNVSDLSRLHAALLGGWLLPPELLAEMKRPARDGATYGHGLRWRVLDCGTTVYGHDGDALGYSTWSFATADLRRQVTVSITPWGPGKPKDRVTALLNRVFC